MLNPAKISENNIPSLKLTAKAPEHQWLEDDISFWEGLFCGGGELLVAGSVVNVDMDVSKNSGTPKSSILIRFSIVNHPFWGTTIFGNTHINHDELNSILET